MGAGGSSNKHNGVTMQPTTRLPESQHMVYSVDGHPLARRSDLHVLVEYAIRNGTAWRHDNAVKNGDAVECEDCPYALYDRRPRSESAYWTCTLQREDAPQCIRLNLVAIAADEAEDVLGLDLTDPWIRTHWTTIVADVIYRVINPQRTPATEPATGSQFPRPRHVMEAESDDIRHHYPLMLDTDALMTDADAVGVMACNGETITPAYDDVRVEHVDDDSAIVEVWRGDRSVSRACAPGAVVATTAMLAQLLSTHFAIQG